MKNPRENGTRMPKTALFCFVIFLAHVSGTQMRKGPYLVYPADATKMKVVWQLKNTATCTIAWGTTSSYELASRTTEEINSGAEGHQHIFTIEGLTPGKKYYYRIVENGSAHTGDFYAAAAATQRDLVFYAYGDSRSSATVHNEVCKAILNDMHAEMEKRQTFLMHNGDFCADSHIESQWDQTFFNRSSLSALELMKNVPIMAARGNHENKAYEGKMVFRKLLPYDFIDETFSYYSFEYGPALVVVIDDNDYIRFEDPDGPLSYRVGSPQYNWIEQELSTTTRQWKIILYHTPAWSANGSHPNKKYKIADLHPLFKKHDVAVSINGDNHYYARAMSEGIPYITTGGAGASLYTPESGQPNVVYTNKAYHFMRFETNEDTLKATAISKDNQAIDQFSVVREPVAVTSVKEYVRKKNIPLFMAGTRNRFSVEIPPGEQYRISIVHANGQILASQQGFGPTRYECKTDRFPAGVYIVTATIAGMQYSEKILSNRSGNQ